MRAVKSQCIACRRNSSIGFRYGTEPGALYIWECERPQCRATQSYQSAPFLGSFASILKEPYR